MELGVWGSERSWLWIISKHCSSINTLCGQNVEFWCVTADVAFKGLTAYVM
jgi:hypothetical protein